MADSVAFTTPQVARFFLACRTCFRVKPHWEVSPADVDNEDGDGRCRTCGDNTFIPYHIPEWRAALLVLGMGWLWRKTLRRKDRWDPRVPMRRP